MSNIDTTPDLTAYSDGTTILAVPHGGDLEFTVEWDVDTEVTITDATATVERLDTGEQVLDLTPFISIDQGIVNVIVPAATTSVLRDWGAGWWRFIATSDTGSTKVLMEGPAHLRVGTVR